jgi:integrase
MHKKKTNYHPIIARFTDANLAANTRRAYAADMRDFRHYGGKVPASPRMVMRYLAEAADWCSISTLKRRLMAIRHAHVERGLASPTDDPEVKAILRGIKRQFGVAQRQAAPLLRLHLREIVRKMTGTPIDLRDKALLLLGFSGAFRRSELVGLNVEDLERVPQGILVHLRRSKTDQESSGRIVAIPKVRGSLCAVTAVERWMKAADIHDGPLFRRLTRTGRASRHRLNAGYVSLLLKSRLHAIGIDSTKYSAHSLRAGLVTEAAKAGVPAWKIRQQTGHKTDQMVARYVRDADLWGGNAAAAASMGR